MIEEIVIKSESDAFETLAKALSDKVSDTAHIKFEGWPVFKLTIEGEDFHESIPTRVMHPIIDLQKEIYRIYCRARYNTEELRKLTDKEKEILELVVAIRPGSTKFITEIFKSLNEIIKSANMTGGQVVTTLVSISALLTCSWAWEDWLASKEREHGQEVSVRLSQEETRRLSLMAEAMKKEPMLKSSNDSIADFRSHISRKLKPTDQIKINEKPIVDGVKASEIVQRPKEIAEEIRLDGEFIVNEIKFPEVYGGVYRLSVSRKSDNQTLKLEAAPNKLTPEQFTILKDGGFASKSIYMEINARRLRGVISAANLVLIRWPD